MSIERKIRLPVVLVLSALAIVIAILTVGIGSDVIFREWTQHEYKFELDAATSVYMRLVDEGWIVVLPLVVLVPGCLLFGKSDCSPALLTWYVCAAVFLLSIWLLWTWFTVEHLRWLNRPM